jgi:hypothetical protein
VRPKRQTVLLTKLLTRNCPSLPTEQPSVGVLAALPAAYRVAHGEQTALRALLFDQVVEMLAPAQSHSPGNVARLFRSIGMDFRPLWTGLRSSQWNPKRLGRTN